MQHLPGGARNTVISPASDLGIDPSCNARLGRVLPGLCGLLAINRAGHIYFCILRSPLATHKSQQPCLALRAGQGCSSSESERGCGGFL